MVLDTALLTAIVCIGSFLSTDLLLFFVCFEMSLIPVFLLLNLFGGEENTYASFQFFLYTLLGSFGMLLSIIYLFQVVGSFHYENIHAHTFLFTEELWLWLGFFIAFSIKIPLVPLHTWLPKTYHACPTAGSVMLSGVLSTLGAYGLLKFMHPFSRGVRFFSAFCLRSICTIHYLCVICSFWTKDAKRMIAYASVAHMGVVALGIFAGTYDSFMGAAFQMIAHALISAGLFFMAGLLHQQFNTYSLDQLGGLAKTMPLCAALGMILMLSAVSLPGTAGFVGELYVFLGAFKQAPIAVSLAAQVLFSQPCTF